MVRTLNSYKGLTKRNSQVFLKDKMAVFLSMLTQIIVLGLFLLFIKSSYVDSINSGLGALKDSVEKADIEALVNSWMIAGVTGTAVDYNASSVKGSVIVMSYFSGAVLCSLITSTVLLTAGLLFLTVTGTFVWTAVDILMLYGLVVLGSISATIILMTCISFFKKDSTFSSFSVMVSAGIGFVVGAYIPVSQFGETTQTIVNLVPGSQITGLMRRILVTPAIENISNSLNGADNGEFAKGAKELFATSLNIFGKEINTGFMLTYSFVIVAVFILLNIILFRFNSKRKS